MQARDEKRWAKGFSSLDWLNPLPRYALIYSSYAYGNPQSEANQLQFYETTYLRWQTVGRIKPDEDRSPWKEPRRKDMVSTTVPDVYESRLLHTISSQGSSSHERRIRWSIYYRQLEITENGQQQRWSMSPRGGGASVQYRHLESYPTAKNAMAAFVSKTCADKSVLH